MGEYTFGMAIRAARLGYHPVPGVGFVRIRAGTGMPPHRIDVAPFDHIPVSRGAFKGDAEFRVWWDDKESEEVVSETLRNHIHAPVRKAVTLSLGEYGELV